MGSADDTGRAGVHGVGLLVAQRLGWKFREQHESDVGIDAQIEILDSGLATGRLLALQIKAGRSQFTEPTPAPPGWLFRPRRGRYYVHYWLNHDLPVLVVLYDEDLHIGYWQHVRADTVVPTGIGVKIVVPARHRLDESAAQHLRDIAYARRAGRDTPGPAPATAVQPSRAEAWNWLLSGEEDLPLVRDVTDRALLGIQPALALPPDASTDLSPDLPTYVPRDVDRDLRAAVATARMAGGFVLLIGASAAGKSRTAYEAIRAVLPDWRILMPASAADLADLVIGGAPLGHTVIWLDELDRFLGPGQLTARLVRRLRANRAQPVLIIGSLRPMAYDRLAARSYHEAQDVASLLDDTDVGQPAADPLAPTWSGADERLVARPRPPIPDPTVEARAVLALVTHRFQLSDQMSATEHLQAAQAAETDPRVAEALSYKAQTGLPAILAAAPDLIQRIQHPDPTLGREVLAAAAYARRCGYAGAIPPLLLQGLAEAVSSPDRSGLVRRPNGSPPP